MRSDNLDVGAAGEITGNINLYGDMAATIATAWILSRPAMINPRRVVWLLAMGVGLATIPSFIAFWTHSLWLTQAML